VTAEALPLTFQVLGAPARLAAPGALWLLAAVLALAVVGAVQLHRRRALLARVAGPQARRVAPRAGTTLPAARLGASLLGLALLALALSRPQCGTRTELAKRYGVDVVIALDVSRSMLARDLKPDRLGRATLEVGALLDSLAGDRVGLVVFAGEAFVQCPLTTDYAAARLFLRAVSPQSVPQQGSDLGNALQAARQVLEASSAGDGRAKVVLLVTDGEDLEGGAAAAAARLGEAGIRVHALAVGTPAGEPIPLTDAAGRVTGYKKDRGGEPVVTRLDLATLRAVVEKGGGELFEVGSPDRGPAAFRAALEKLQKSELESRLVVQYEDRYALAAFPGFLLLLAALLLPEGRAPRRDDDEEAEA
jgi:Ca-activated chloride channel family protein